MSVKRGFEIKKYIIIIALKYGSFVENVIINRKHFNVLNPFHFVLLVTNEPHPYSL